MTKTGDAAKPQMDLDDHAENAMEWAKGHSRELSIAGIAVAVAVAAFLFWRSAAEKKEANAGRALGEAERSVTAGNLPLAQSDLEKLIQRYSGTVAADQAGILLSQVFFDQGKTAEGLKALEGVDGGGPFKATLHAMRAAGNEQSGKNIEAADEYLKAADAATSESDKSQFKADAARAFQAGGKKEEALKIWQTIASDEENPLNAEAKLRVGELSATVEKG